MSKQIVTVWMDKTSDERRWIVDTDVVGGGESDTIKTFAPTDAGKKKAIKFANEYAAKKGLAVEVR